ncbi:glycosyltransferase family protein [Niveomyces insectorum RCEF 264]|uniref:UDP-N-acetylglucosamine transferase subunit ALG14 n=1 Tax=Niveomyces insectorum RCEF 264 TaxID=1081102 RepID=A0A167NQ69_9HYPO|nr:glycosyltransferase family protein [Niveomyces insectorum RCEF 264]
MDRAWQAARHGPVPDKVVMPPTYFVYVLGSGGHTGELCESIKQQFRPNPLSHRRYLISSGDRHSENAVAALEGLIERTCSSSGNSAGAGTWDIVRVVRARRVHQPLWTAWFSALLSALSIVQALLRSPKAASPDKTLKGENDGPSDGTFDYPHLIVTNGPGTGFIVCLVAFLLKMFFIVPANRCSVLYIETWAHVRTLSLTGKLFYYTRIADMFVVQHEELAKLTGERFVGEVTKFGNLLGIKKTLKPANPQPVGVQPVRRQSSSKSESS